MTSAVVLASPGEHPLIGFLPAGRQKIQAGDLAWFRGRRTVCRGAEARRDPTLPSAIKPTGFPQVVPW